MRLLNTVSKFTFKNKFSDSDESATQIAFHALIVASKITRILRQRRFDISGKIYGSGNSIKILKCGYLIRQQLMPESKNARDINLILRKISTKKSIRL